MTYRSSWMCPLMVAMVMLAIPIGEGCAATASGVRLGVTARVRRYDRETFTGAHAHRSSRR